MRIHVLVGLATLAMAGPSASDPACRDNLPFHSIFASNALNLEFPEPEDLVIRTEKQWCEFWARAHSAGTSPPPCDLGLADFQSEAVVATAIGNRGSGCFGVSISCIETSRGALRVLIRERVPGPGCICTQSLVSPVHAVVVDKPVGLVDFVHETTALECGS
jgi:hypothetical protein